MKTFSPLTNLGQCGMRPTADARLQDYKTTRQRTGRHPPLHKATARQGGQERRSEKQTLTKQRSEVRDRRSEVRDRRSEVSLLRRIATASQGHRRSEKQDRKSVV